MKTTFQGNAAEAAKSFTVILLLLHKAAAARLMSTENCKTGDVVPVAVHQRDGATANVDESSCVPVVNDIGE